MILQQLINGIMLGSVYALIALGYTMVYGVMKFINFAHGDVYMWGAFFCYVSGTLPWRAILTSPDLDYDPDGDSGSAGGARGL